MTANKASSETRLRIIRKIRRMMRCGPGTNGDVLIRFIQAMDTRANRRNGGLGRK